MSDGRAVIIGGGGVTGIAWEAGILEGLGEAGVDLEAADAIIGTSAGSFAGAWLAAGQATQYFERQFEDAGTEIAASMSPETIERWQRAIVDSDGDPQALGRALGRVALSTPTVSSEEKEAVVTARLLSADWPDRPLKMTAIDAHTGELHLLDKHSGMSLITAAAASGAVPGVWPPVEANGRTWIDGGSCSSANVLLGADYDKVVVIAPTPNGWPGSLGARDEFAQLHARVSESVLIVPDDASREAIGPNAFDPSRRALAARAGREQGRQVAAEVSLVWSRASR